MGSIQRSWNLQHRLFKWFRMTLYDSKCYSLVLEHCVWLVWLVFLPPASPSPSYSIFLFLSLLFSSLTFLILLSEFSNQSFLESSPQSAGEPQKQWLMAERRPKKRHHRLHSNIKMYIKLIIPVDSFLVHGPSNVVCISMCTWMCMCAMALFEDWRCVQISSVSTHLASLQVTPPRSNPHMLSTLTWGY